MTPTTNAEACDLTVGYITNVVLVQMPAEHLRPQIEAAARRFVDAAMAMDFERVAEGIAARSSGPSAWLARKVPKADIKLSAKSEQGLRAAALSMVARDAPPLILEALQGASHADYPASVL